MVGWVGVGEVNLAEKGWSRSAAEEEEEWREGYVSKKKNHVSSDEEDIIAIAC